MTLYGGNAAATRPGGGWGGAAAAGMLRLCDIRNAFGPILYGVSNKRAVDGALGLEVAEARVVSIFLQVKHRTFAARVETATQRLFLTVDDGACQGDRSVVETWADT